MHSAGTGGVSEDVVEGVDAAMANMAMQERPSAFIELRSATGAQPSRHSIFSGRTDSLATLKMSL